MRINIRIGAHGALKQFLLFFLLMATTIAVMSGSRIEAQALVRLEEIDGQVHDVERDGREIWLAGSEGVFLTYTNEFRVVEIPPITGTGQETRLFYAIERMGDEIWLGANDGIFKAEEDGYRRVGLILGESDSAEIRSLERESSGRVWIGSDQGLYYVEPADPLKPVRAAPREVSSVSDQEISALKVLSDGDLLLGRGDGVFRGGASSFEPIRPDPFDAIGDIEPYEDGFLLHAVVERDYSVYSLGEQGVSSPLRGNVDDLCLMGGDIWLAIKGAVELFASQKKAVITVDGSVVRCGQAGNSAFLVAERKIFHADLSNLGPAMKGLQSSDFVVLSDTVDTLPRPPPFDINAIKEVGPDVFFYGNAGAYRFSRRVGVYVDTDTSSTRSGGRVRIAGVRYLDERGMDPFPDLTRRRFRVYFHDLEHVFNEGSRDEGRYKDPGVEHIDFFGEATTIYAKVIDAYGTRFPNQELEAPAGDDFWPKISSQFISQFIAFAVSVLVSLLLFTFVPVLIASKVYWRFARSSSRHSKRLQYFMVIVKWCRKGFLYRPLLMPGFKKVVSVFRSIYVEKHCVERGGQSPGAKGVLEELGCQEARVLLRKDVDLGILYELRDAIAASRSGGFSRCLPLIVRLESGGSELKRDGVGEAVIDVLMSEPHTDKEFCDKFSRSAPIVYLFSVEKIDSHVTSEIISFFESRRHHSYLLVAEVTPVLGGSAE